MTAGAKLAAWVHVTGEVDLCTSPKLEGALRAAQLHARLVVLDMREVSFIDSSGAHALLDANAGADWGLPRLLLIPGPVVERFLTLARIAEQIWTIELDPSEPERRLSLVPDLRAA